ncbi:MAG: hypothetical protein O7G85_15730 [Planctomycetota bacterium]|nr:hypothetical protein [Planctomycetota bacterium]
MKVSTTSTQAPRNAPLASSAATIVVLLSMANMVSAVPTLVANGSSPVQGEARSTMIEASTVRKLAVAVVKAAARDLLGTDRLDHALTSQAILAIDEMLLLEPVLASDSISMTYSLGLDDR